VKDSRFGDALVTDQADTSILLSDYANGVLRLTLNDDKRRNALSRTMLAALSSAFTAAAEDPQVRVIVLAGNGPVFCSGHDLKEMTAARAEADKGEAAFERLFAACAAVMQLIVNNPVPVIAEIAGVATAAGCQLVASCDLAMAANSAKFASPGVNLGLFCSTPMVALSRNVSRKHAMEMLLSGDMIDSDRAQQIGLINNAFDGDELTDQTMALANKIASKSSMTVAVGKRAFYAQAEMSLAEAYAYTSQVMTDNMLTADAEEGIDAFLGKRSPQWNDQ
jgi:enoyl-CoA hydratase/carnithine racemase